ncbi:MAG: Hpt domain-containing protein [Bacteroidota bacterium]
MQTIKNLINLDYLKLMADGDREMEKVMLDMLLTELPSEFEIMKSLHYAQDWKELSKVSHKMKSTLAFIGNEEITEANLKVEQLTKQGTPPTNEDIICIGDNMKTFENLLPAVINELNQTAAKY